ncbi:hypothetical protein Harman_20840 [Haloarcula mannanilytica]|uniref:Solute-binding protein family 5 domain-containing protein n=2 Tax=Haloarcula mannanilytica TaxID=2509225 RepID=A0A4C2EPR8_9EURY|nr:hypothetical protein Harman_20840 [Haloarcula mannanilytica]
MIGATGGVGMIAGCGGSGGSESGGGGGDGSSSGEVTTAGGDIQPVDNAFANTTTDNPTNWQHNVYNFTTPYEHEMQNDQFQRYNIETGEYTEYALQIDEWAGSEERVVLKVRDGLTWHNGDPGDPVTGEDLKAKFGCEQIVGNTVADHYTDMQVVGDKKLELTLDGQVNKPIFRESLNYQWIDTPYRLYGKYIEAYEDATTDSERSDVKSQLRNDTFEEPYGNGPFQFIERSENRYRMELYEHHPDADQINWQYWDVQRVSTDTASVALNMVPDGDVDTIRNYNPPASVYNNRQEGHLTTQLPALWGQALPFNCEHEDFGNVRVRQAIAEFIDRKSAAESYGQFGQFVEAPSGLVGNIAGDNSPSDRWKDWVSEEGASALHRYRDAERGRQLLRDEGYEKVDGQWQRPDGSRLELPITVPSDLTDWHPIYQTVVGSLEQEGIKAELKMVDSTSYWSDHYLAGDYVGASTGWTLQNQHPFYTFGMYFRTDNEFMNLTPGELQAPPFGEPDGDLQDVDIDGLMNDLRTSTGETQTEYIDQLAWIMNQTLPMIPLIEINDVLWMTDDDWDWKPEMSDSAWQTKWPQWWFPRMGLLKAKGSQ